MHAAALRYLLKVADLGSIRRAADALNVAASAVNRQILNLEHEIGTPLFDRTAKGVRPTEAGRLLIRHARETLSGYAHVMAEINGLAGEHVGEVGIIGLASAIESLMPPVMVELAGLYPGIELRLVEADPAQAVAGLKAQNFELAIIFVDRRHHDFQMLAQLDTAIGAVMRADHPLARRQSVTLTECAEHDVIMFTDRWMIAPIMEAEFGRTGARFKPRIISNSMVVMATAVRNGLGIGFFTPIGFIDEIRRGEIVHVPITPGLAGAGGLGLFAAKGAPLSPPVRAVAEHLAGVFGHLQGELDGLRG